MLRNIILGVNTNSPDLLLTLLSFISHYDGTQEEHTISELYCPEIIQVNISGIYHCDLECTQQKKKKKASSCDLFLKLFLFEGNMWLWP